MKLANRIPGLEIKLVKKNRGTVWSRQLSRSPVSGLDSGLVSPWGATLAHRRVIWRVVRSPATSWLP